MRTLWKPLAGLGEDAIPSVLLPQATSARHGMEILGALVESHGAAEGVNGAGPASFSGVQNEFSKPVGVLA